MPALSLEERLANVEQELADLKKQIEHNGSKPVPWWEERFGAFEGSKEYELADRLGREYRESLRPKED